MNRVLNVILTHQPPAQVVKLLQWWRDYCDPADILIAYGGTMDNFKALPEVQKFFIADPRLRVKDPQRDKQSYGGVWRGIAEFLHQAASGHYTHIYFAEFDHLPVVADLSAKLLARLQAEKADALFHHLRQTDGSSNFFYLYHACDPAFAAFWEKVSVRPDKKTVLQMHGSASFWTKEAMLKVAEQPEEVPIYLELYIPTLAHHLGFRLRDFGDQNRCVLATPSPDLTVETARQKGCWTVHPIKLL